MTEGYSDRPTREHLITRVNYLISDPQIKQFTVKALQQAPNYIWKINASTSGKYHHGETQTEHVLQALRIGEHFLRIIQHPQIAEHLPPWASSVYLSAVALHDLYKCGLPGRENRDTYGAFRTDPLHPLYPPQALAEIQVWQEGSSDLLAARECPWWPDFVNCVSRHSGPWSPQELPRSIKKALGSLPVLTFLADYVASRKE